MRRAIYSSIFCFAAILIQVQPCAAQSPNNTKVAVEPGVRPTLQTPTYRVTVTSVSKKANNLTVTLVFENLTPNTLKIKWLNKSWLRGKEAPYLVDENATKYQVQAKQFEGILGDEVYGGAEVLPGTTLKLAYVFFGAGSGASFDLIGTDLTRGNAGPLAIKGLKITANEDSNVKTDSPAFITESYRVVVESVRRVNTNIAVTLVFESLTNKTFIINWGSGYENASGIWESSEPYLIDENADRYYLRQQDSGKVVGTNIRWEAELLPGTKLKTVFLFDVNSESKLFTLASKEQSPQRGRPVVIKGLKLE